MVTWADLTPTLLDFAGAPVPVEDFDGRSFREGLDGAPLADWDEVYGSHTSHEITMYYPMRSIRTRRYKLIHNLASGLPYPFALDLIQSPTWVGLQKSGATVYGQRTIAQFLRRPEFELYDLSADPHEVVNLSDAPALQTVRRELVAKLKAFQVVTQDPWLHKWKYE